MDSELDPALVMDTGWTAVPHSSDVKHDSSVSGGTAGESDEAPQKPAAKVRVRSRKKKGADENAKRRCVSTACIACRRRKSKCDGATPSCAACSQVYGTECIYDPNSDHRRKGVYKKDIDGLKTRSSTLQTLIQAILNYPENEVPSLVRQIRTCESLDTVAESIFAKDNRLEEEEEDAPSSLSNSETIGVPTFETKLSGKMGELRVEDGSTRYIGGTSNLIFLGAGSDIEDSSASHTEQYQQQENPITSWTNVTSDPELILHLMNMYFTWHYTYFTTLSKSLFYRDFLLGKPPLNTRRKTEYCTPLLVNAMLALGCHFTANPGAREVRDDSATAGDHFFKEAKRLIMENDEHEKPKLTTVQALALMSVREAGCGREAKGWVYSGMSFRMACDLGLNLDSGVLKSGRTSSLNEEGEDARRITFWGCFLFDKCWSNYMGRLPQLPMSIATVPKFEVFPVEDADIWAAYTDSGFNQSHAQPSRTRAVALQISALCEISNDLLNAFYNPQDMDKAKGKQAELNKLSHIHQRLEGWRRDLPKELEPREGGLPATLVMHMFFQLLYIHLFRPFLKYNQATSPLPANVSPRKLCTQAATTISKLLRLYKRSHGLRQICNIAVYIAHSACTIHLLNLPEKNARRDIIHGVKHLEEIAESWLCARRTLRILNILARKWKVELPEEAAAVLARAEAKFGAYNGDAQTPKTVPSTLDAQAVSASTSPQAQPPPQLFQQSPTSGYKPLPSTTAPYTYITPPTTTSASSTNNPPLPRRTSNPASLPPQSAAEPAYARARPPHRRHHSSSQQQQTTAAVVGTPQSVESTATATATTMTTTHTAATAGASPSQMFGGVEQLLRESQDWWLRDQSQLAMGFGNWGVSGPGAGEWWNGAAAAAAVNGVAGGVGVAFGGGSNGLNGVGGGNGIGGGNGGVSTYNEDEWYQ